MHDLHEAQTYLYASTGTGPYNEAARSDHHRRVVDAGEERSHGDDEARCARRLDLRVLRRLGAELHVLHRALAQRDRALLRGPELRTGSATRCGRAATTTSREWFRPNPPLAVDPVGTAEQHQHPAVGDPLRAQPRRQEQGDSISRTTGSRTSAPSTSGKNGPVYGWVIPAGQHRKADAADAVNELRRQGLEVYTAARRVQGGQRERRSRATTSFAATSRIGRSPTCTSRSRTIRRPTRRPYDDTGWTFQFMRNVVIKPIGDKSLLTQQMTLLTADAKAPGGIEGHRAGRDRRAHDRQQPRDVPLQARGRSKMQAAEEDFEAGGHKFRAGAFVIPNADRAALEPTLKDARADRRGRSRRRRRVAHARSRSCRASATSTLVATRRTKAGCARRSTPTACPTPISPTSSCAKATCAQKYDVIIFPHVGGNAQSQVNGHSQDRARRRCRTRRPRTRRTSARRIRADDIRGGMGWEGLMELVKFVQRGRHAASPKGSTSTIFPEYNITTGVTVENPDGLFVRGSVMRGVITDRRSPIAYGYRRAGAGVFQPGAGAERQRRRWRHSAVRRRRRR